MYSRRLEKSDTRDKSAPEYTDKSAPEYTDKSALEMVRDSQGRGSRNHRRKGIPRPQPPYNYHYRPTTTTTTTATTTALLQAQAQVRTRRDSKMTTPNPTRNYSIRRATGSVTDDELQQLVDLSVAAFARDPFLPMITGNDVEFYPKWFEYWITDSLLGAEVYVAEDNDTKRIVGYSTWYAPGKGPFEMEEQREKALNPIMERAPADIRAWMTESFFDQYDELVEKAVGKDAKSKAWNLHLMAVYPSHHRQGICGSLIDRLAKTELPSGGLISVETYTDLNVEIYKRLGFTLRTDNNFLKTLGEPFKVNVLTLDVPNSAV